jgi:hypothetical protein
MADVGLDLLRPAPMSSASTSWRRPSAAVVLAAGVSARIDVDDGEGVVFVVGLRMTPARRAGER